MQTTFYKPSLDMYLVCKIVNKIVQPFEPTCIKPNECGKGDYSQEEESMDKEDVDLVDPVL